MAGAELMDTTGAIPAVSLAVTRLPDPVWPPAVCEAVTNTGPSAKPLTSMPELDQMLPVQAAEAATEPTRTATGVSLAEQVPETV